MPTVTNTVARVCTQNVCNATAHTPPPPPQLVISTKRKQRRDRRTVFQIAPDDNFSEAPERKERREKKGKKKKKEKIKFAAIKEETEAARDRRRRQRKRGRFEMKHGGACHVTECIRRRSVLQTGAMRFDEDGR